MRFLVCLLAGLISAAAQAETRPEQQLQSATEANQAPRKKETSSIPESELTDISDATRSKQYMHRTILSQVIKETSRFNLGRFYLNHLMGFSNVYQTAVNYVKFSSGFQGISAGYVTTGGHGFELGTELSVVTNVFAGYRFFVRPKNFSVWPVVGMGVGKQVQEIKFIDGPFEAQDYDGSTNLLFGSLAILIPLVDIGLKAEVRFNFHGSDRITFLYGVGAMVFL